MKRWKRTNKIADRILMGILIGIMLLGTYVIYDSLYLYGHDPLDLSYYFEGGKEEWEQMPEHAVGWLTIYDTNINYAVMQGENNEEYLNKNEYGEFALIGSIFLDFRNHSGWKDQYNLLYGHHMTANRMFGSLDYFLDKDFFQSHRTGILKTRGADYELHIFAVLEDSAGNPVIFDAGDEAHPDKLPAYLKKHSVIYQKPDGGKILAMSTCEDAGSTRRLIVFATMHTVKEPGTLYSEGDVVQPGKIVPQESETSGAE